jgi:hypothetical protein
MNTPDTALTDADIEKASRLWADYQRTHDVTGHTGQAVGIDPATGQVWFGDSARDIALRREATGLWTPLFFLRVGQDYYARKGGGR